MFIAVQSVFPNFLTLEGGAGTSIKDQRPPQGELTQNEKQLPAVTCEGLAGQGSMAPSFLPLQLPSSGRPVSGTTLSLALCPPDTPSS